MSQGCRPGTKAAEVFEPWEVGRTLIFENPSISDAPPERVRFNRRIQKQVVRSTEDGSGLRVDTTYTTFQGQQGINLLLKDGSVSLIDAQGKRFPILPEGFPDRTSSWQAGTYRMRVLGRGRWGRQAPVLPATRPPEGVWVEGEPILAGPKVRILYIPDFGEVEQLEWRNGKWVTTNLMVAWTFQDVPRGRE
jgi:hypothetical protein